MTAKEYLQQAFKIERLIKSKLEQVAKIESLATSASQSFSDSGVHTSYDITKGSKVENAVVNIIGLKEDIQKQTAELVKLRAGIQQTIGRIENLTVQYLLGERYLLYKSWDSICEATGFSKDYVYRLHRQGLQFVEYLLKR